MPGEANRIGDLRTFRLYLGVVTFAVSLVGYAFASRAAGSTGEQTALQTVLLAVAFAAVVLIVRVLTERRGDGDADE